MEFEKFKSLAKEYNLVPVYEVIAADLITPVLAYSMIREKNKQSFLLESVEGSMNLARYSFIGIDPEKIIKNKGEKIFIQNGKENKTNSASIFDQLKSEIKNIKQPFIPELPNFTGGIVGFLGYENVSLIEPIVKFSYKRSDSFDSVFGVYKTILAFDHYKHQIILITNISLNEKSDLEAEYSTGKEKLNLLKEKLKTKNFSIPDFRLTDEINMGFDKEEFFKIVNKAKIDITNGEIFQIVLSKKFSCGYAGDLLNVYRALRIINPSPYMYFLEFNDDTSILGTSPEDLLRVKNNKAQILPIAGTRRRGINEDEDKELEDDLLNDPKELAEHTMLVDLGRNDLGRVCKYSTVEVKEMMKIQRYSHVMHIVSKVEGELAENKDSIDALKSCYPAGTVSGAPKIRAMQLINEYENEERNVYAGAVGYLDFSGNLDMCIAIRTLFSKRNIIYWQAGAGIVADSKPELEAKEIINKSAVLVNALKYAEELNENPGN
jgi:anthranilate synthase component I